MHASPYRYSAAHLFYAITLAATATTLFGWLGLPISLFVLLVWWQLLAGAYREIEMHATTATCTFAEPSIKGQNPARSAFSKIELLVVFSILALLVGLLLPSVSDSDPMRHAEISMRMVAKALKAYHADHGEYPPPILEDLDGKPMHSWRALLLPYLDEPPLAAAYRYDEPWNSLHNAALAQYRPWHFRTYYPHADVDAVTTSMHAFPVGAQLLLVEHEDLFGNWLEPQQLDDSTLERFAKVPDFKRGFWHEGFFASSYRGRLIVSPDHSFQVHPTDAATISASLSAATDSSEPVEIGQRLIRFHPGNAIHLSIFAIVVLYPIRWLHRIRSCKTHPLA